jgi:hypothetical protein
MERTMIDPDDYPSHAELERERHDEIERDERALDPRRRTRYTYPSEANGKRV